MRSSDSPHERAVNAYAFSAAFEGGNLLDGFLGVTIYAADASEARMLRRRFRSAYQQYARRYGNALVRSTLRDVRAALDNLDHAHAERLR